MSKWKKHLNRRWEEAIKEYDFQEYLKHAKVDPSNVNEDEKEEHLRNGKFLFHKPVSFLREMLDMNKEWELDNIEPPHDDFDLWALEPAHVGESEIPVELQEMSDQTLKRVVYDINNFTQPETVQKDRLFKSYQAAKQNIKKALMIAPDAVGFYNNLMNIQEYLAKIGVINEDGTSLYSTVHGTDGDLIDEHIENFDMNQFKQLKSFAERVRYAKEHLEYLGQGSSRIAFKFHDNKVLKIAKNPKGLGQNALESDIGTDDNFQDVVARVFETDPNFQWIVVEFAPQISQSKFQQIEGYKWRTFGIVLSDIKYGRDWQKDVDGDEGEKFMYSQSPNRFGDSIIEIMERYHLAVGDLVKLSSYGVANRDGEPSVVLVDAGMDDNVFKSHYAQVREAVLREIRSYLSERVLSAMKDSSTVDVEDKCKLNGNGDGTSEPCNQGEIKNLKIKDLREAIEGEDTKPEPRLKYGCLMADCNIKNWSDVINLIDPADVWDNDANEFGLETEPHVTILYGFHNSVNGEDVIRQITDVYNKPIDINLVNISYFEAKDYDVLKFDVESDILHTLNDLVKKWPHTSNFPDYHPHMTIAYVNKGTGQKYAKEFPPKKLRSTELSYSFANGDKIKQPLTVVKEWNLSEDDSVMLPHGYFKTSDALAPTPEHLYVSHVEVNPEVRGAGHFKEIMAAIEEYAKQHGKKFILFDPDISQGRDYYNKLLSIYKHHGFTEFLEDPSLLVKKVA